MLNLSYTDKSEVMSIIFRPYAVRSNEYTSSYKNIPILVYDEYKEFIDFTTFRGVFRGVRRIGDNSTRRINADSVDIYELDIVTINSNRMNRMEYLKGLVAV